MAKRASGGRPRSPNAKRVQINVRVQAGEKRRFIAEAKASGLSLAEWSRLAMLAAVGKTPLKE